MGMLHGDCTQGLLNGLAWPLFWSFGSKKQNWGGRGLCWAHLISTQQRLHQHGQSGLRRSTIIQNYLYINSPLGLKTTYSLTYMTSLHDIFFLTRRCTLASMASTSLMTSQIYHHIYLNHYLAGSPIRHTKTKLTHLRRSRYRETSFFSIASCWSRCINKKMIHYKYHLIQKDMAHVIQS